MGFIDVEICNWDKFNPRKDLKAPSWFRLNNTFFENSDFYDFTHTEMLVWVYLLSIASKKQSGSFAANIAHAERVGRFKESVFLEALRKLQDIGAVTWTLRVRVANVSTTSHYITRQDITGQNITNTPETPAAPERDLLEAAYKAYPRKEGKTGGMERAKREIRSHGDLELLKTAIRRFTEHHRKLKTETKFIPHFSTFMSTWRDWLDPETGTAEQLVPKPMGIMEILDQEKKAKEAARATA